MSVIAASAARGQQTVDDPRSTLDEAETRTDVEQAADAEGEKPWYLEGAIDFRSEYFFRGYLQNSHGYIIQPYGEFGYTVYENNANGLTLTPFAGVWFNFTEEQGPSDLREHLLSQDLIYVGGGSVISLLGAWRAHGLDQILFEAWEAGVVLCGLSAGSLCWFAEGVSGFHGTPQRVEGIGMLPFSNCVHYERDGSRRSAFHAAIADGMHSSTIANAPASSAARASASSRSSSRCTL